jgi:hypothetical protein
VASDRRRHGARRLLQQLRRDSSTTRPNRHGIRLRLDPATHDLGWSTGGSNPTKYTTTFIGKGGRVLKVSTSLNPSYRFRAGDRWVRAVVVDSDGRRAWTQPVLN